MHTTTSSTVGLIVIGFMVDVVVVCIGAVLAWLLAGIRKSQEVRSNHLDSTLDGQDKKLDSHGDLLIRITAWMEPTVRELERQAVSIERIDRDVTKLTEWRTTHESWAKDTLNRLEVSAPNNRITDSGRAV